MYSVGWAWPCLLQTLDHQQALIIIRQVGACIKRACVHLLACDWVAGDTVRPWTYSQSVRRAVQGLWGICATAVGQKYN